MASKSILNSSKFVLALGGVGLILLSGLFISLQWQIEPSGMTWLISMNKVISEMLLVIAACLLLYAVWWPLRLVSASLFLIYSFTVVSQLNAIQFSSSYLPPVALENAKHVDFLLDTTKLGWIVILAICLLVASLFIAKSVRPVPRIGGRSMVALALIVLA
ncbi:MAG: hypothetical protein MK188_00770, partial [Gammaproteobacteria bacterium]|nr:hypothetical protein [Gammaproteobacteria bacterium]